MPPRHLKVSVPRMKKNGRLQKGMNADIVVFYPEAIHAVGT